MSENDRKFIESRMKTPEALKWIKRLGSSRDERIDYSIEEIVEKISYLPHAEQYRFSRGIAGTRRIRCLLPGFKYMTKDCE